MNLRRATAGGTGTPSASACWSGRAASPASTAPRARIALAALARVEAPRDDLVEQRLDLRVLVQ